MMNWVKTACLYWVAAFSLVGAALADTHEQESVLRKTLVGKTVFQSTKCISGICSEEDIQAGKVLRSVEFYSEDGRILATAGNQDDDWKFLQQGVWRIASSPEGAVFCTGDYSTLMTSQRFGGENQSNIYYCYLLKNIDGNIVLEAQGTRNGQVTEELPKIWSIDKIADGNAIPEMVAELGETYSNRSETTWEIDNQIDPMTDKPNNTVRSIQSNESGVTAEIVGSCQNDETILFTALIVDAEGQPTVSIANNVSGTDVGGYAGEMRVNSQPSENPIVFLFDKKGFRNKIVVVELFPSSWTVEPNRLNLLLGAQVFQVGSLAWRIMAKIESSGGELLLKIPVFDNTIRKLAESCGVVAGQQAEAKAAIAAKKAQQDAELADKQAAIDAKKAVEEAAQAELCRKDPACVLRQKLMGCWLAPPGAREANIEVQVRFSLNPDGSVAGSPRVLNGSNDPLFSATAQSAVSAIMECQRYDFLPPESYDSWKDITINFNADMMFGG